jgi:hypothetical protein
MSELEACGQRLPALTVAAAIRLSELHRKLNAASTRAIRWKVAARHAFTWRRTERGARVSG